MAIQNDLKGIKFIAGSILSVLLYMIIITAYFVSGYQIIEFVYCLPIIIVLLVLNYLAFYVPKTNCQYPIFVINAILFVIFLSVYLGVFYGVFDKTLQYHFQNTQNCKVIGKSSTVILNFDSTTGEQYSVLYVDFEIDNQQFLGYGCLSSYAYDESPVGYMTQNSWEFKFYGEITCANRRCSSPFKYSQVKLPSWMCLSSNISYEDLIKIDTCYFYLYNNEVLDNQTQGQAYLNAQSRQNVREVGSFAMISFNKLNVPFPQYFFLLALAFSPMISTSSIFFVLLINLNEQNLLRIFKKFKKYQKRQLY